MDLGPLLAPLATLDALVEAHARLDAEGRLTLGVTDAAKGVTTALLWRRARRPTLLLTPREADAEAAFEQLQTWAGDAVLRYPARAALPYGREEPRPDTVQRRIQVLTLLARGTAPDRPPPLIVASVAAVAEHTLAPADLGRGAGTLAVGGRLAIEALAAALVDAGYTLGPLVESPGEAARRGGLLDVFPPQRDTPLRIEFFGDEVESIRSFDPATQRTLDRLTDAHIGPATEWFPTHDQLMELAGHLGETQDEQTETELATLRRGELPQPARYGPLAARHTLLDHLPDSALVVIDEREAVEAASAELDTLARERREELAARHELHRETPFPHQPRSALLTALESHRPRVDLARWATGREPGTLRLPFAAQDAYAGRLPAAAADTARQLRRGDRVVVATGQAQRYREVLAEAGVPGGGVPAVVVTELHEPPAAGMLTLVQGALPEGWRVPTAQGALSLVTDRELFGFVKQRRALRRTASRRSNFLAEITPGDPVVHVDHGIARFVGITHRTVDEQPRDYLELHYAGGDRLYVPVEQVDRVSRYVGPSGHDPRLTRLGTQEWGRARARVREAVSLVAADLLRLYAARQLLRGHAFGVDTVWQRELESSFPYEETADQLAAIEAVKADMRSARPMDRVVCGDVGFGKTEVAIRATFKAVQDGYQAAVLVPTTVLAEQHERTFRERLASFPVRIEVLSRFRTDAEIREVLTAVRAGEVDIVIGTHRLLQPDVEFANLGLVVVDEEQRFGVAHKERLKRLRLEVDVLALSATPIPRTLHMALTGIRDMSSIDTAPVERQPVQTYVSEWDPALVREAILHEMERGGQVYLVHNRVHSIDEFAHRIRELVPEARIVIGHGQMPEMLLKRTMERFAEGEGDVLICTTIIESGIDIPNVNTLIIDQADRFGLAQLYQLRGRVGRSVQQAYAYLLYPRDRVLSEVAGQRLATIFEANELGSGFQVALRDLEIRGAGNLLGAEQSGQIATVGFDLYTQMLAESVEELKQPAASSADRTQDGAIGGHADGRHGGRAVRAPRAVAIDLPAAAHVPESYIPEIEGRLALYQRIAALGSREDAEALEAETADRLGPLPPPVRQLLWLVRIRLAAAAAAVASVRLEEEIVVLTASPQHPFSQRRLPALPAEVERGRTQLRMPRHALGEQWLEAIEALLRQIGGAQTPAPLAAAGAAAPS